MIRYMLRCASDDHEFEAWFSKSADYEAQQAQGLVCCPLCGGTKICKAPMAPAVKRARPDLAALAARIRQDIETSHDDVGEKFADEARAMHYGEKRKRGIYGTAAPGEAKALIEEGVDIVPLPDAIAPKPKTKLN